MVAPGDKKPIICDVGPRDGLQNQAATLSPGVRAELVNRLAGAGVPRIEAVSFVHPRLVPQMADAEGTVSLIRQREAVTYAGLVLNARGYDRLVTTSLEEVHFAFAVTEAFNRRNQNASVEESIGVAEALISRAHADDRKISITLSVAFGCPFEGAVNLAEVLAAAERVAAAGADEIVFADTIGVAVPRQVRELILGMSDCGAAVGVHLHNTRGGGIANAWVAVECGVDVLDASVGGIGGCPFAPRATGNICTEDLVYLLENEGIDTGIDLDSLIDVAVWLEAILERPLPGQVYRAGPFNPVAARP